MLRPLFSSGLTTYHDVKRLENLSYVCLCLADIYYIILIVIIIILFYFIIFYYFVTPPA